MCIRDRHIDEHGIIDRVAVKTAHRGEILPVLIALKQLLDVEADDAVFNVDVGAVVEHCLLYTSRCV